VTTKKQRRQQVAERTAARKEADRLHGLEMQRIDREKRQQKAYDAERAEKSKKRALAMKKTHEATQAVPVDEEILREYEKAVS
jgi:hypothetical protein